MKKFFLALVAAVTIAYSTMAAPTNAYACRGAECAALVGVGVLGAAIVGGAIANSPGYAYPRTYYPVAGYERYHGYNAGPAYGCPNGYWARRPIRDGYGNVVGFGKPRFFCPN